MSDKYLNDSHNMMKNICAEKSEALLQLAWSYIRDQQNQTIKHKHTLKDIRSHSLYLLGQTHIPAART